MNTMFAAILGGWEWVIVILAVLLLFGAKKIPELARGLGTGIKEFKKATREVTEELQNAADDKSQPQNKSIASTPSQPAQTVSQSAQSSNPPKV
jgi:sec-independent protein translocase protein TatA